jgi:hypothetical protein
MNQESMDALKLGALALFTVVITSTIYSKIFDVDPNIEFLKNINIMILVFICVIVMKLKGKR